jgi:hypothetical protein
MKTRTLLIQWFITLIFNWLITSFLTSYLSANRSNGADDCTWHRACKPWYQNFTRYHGNIWKETSTSRYNNNCITPLSPWQQRYACVAMATAFNRYRCEKHVLPTNRGPQITATSVSYILNLILMIDNRVYYLDW